MLLKVSHLHIFQFEEMVNQFIPSNMTWKGWVKMALQQPLLPVFPVARELFMKTKFSRNGTPAVGAKDSDANIVGENKGQAVIHYSEGQKHPPSRKFRRKHPENQSTASPVPPEPERSSADI